MPPAATPWPPPRPAHGRASWAGLILFAAICLHLAWTDLARPNHNWDMIPYLALVLEGDGLDPAAIHARVYEEIQASPMRAVLLGEVGPVEYRRQVAADPEALRQQLGFYRPKWLYNQINWINHRLGAGLMPATVITSVAGFVLAAAGIWTWLAGYLAGWRLTVAALVTLYFSGLYAMGAVSSPDTLAAGLFLGAWAARRRGRAWFAAGLWLAQLARPDYVVYGWVLLLGEAVWRRRWPDRVVWAYLGLSLATHLTLSLGADAYPWAVLFRHSFIELTAYPATVTQTPSLADYLGVMRDEVRALWVGSRWFALLLVQLALVIPLAGRRPWPEPLIWLALLNLAALAHFLAHPALLLRYFLGPYLAMSGLCFQAGLALVGRSDAGSPAGEVARRPGL